MFSQGFLIALGLAVAIGSLYGPLDANPTFATQAVNTPAIEAQKVLLVTAHPDDEAMFFAPTILSLTKKSPSISLFHVCLSDGNSEGLGTTRQQELVRSLDILGVPPTQRWLVDHPELQDNITLTWDSSVIANVLKPYVSDLKIDTILTFDEQGISSHPNHKALPHGVRNLITSLPRTTEVSPVRLYKLVSVAPHSKYLSFFSVALAKSQFLAYTFLHKFELLIIDFLVRWDPESMTPKFPLHPEAGARPMFVSGYPEYLTALQAMKSHSSQMLWYRWLYVAFSKYLWENTWVEVKIKA